VVCDAEWTPNIGDWNSTRSIIEANPGWGVFCGTEQVMVQTLRAGGVGCITATANLFPKPLRELYDTWESDSNGSLERKVMADTQAGNIHTLLDVHLFGYF
jgi:4-hydroxy-tetrahydrodipicolinate synthase